MGNAIISKHSGGYATVKFENYNDDALIERVLESSFTSYLSNSKDSLSGSNSRQLCFVCRWQILWL